MADGCRGLLPSKGETAGVMVPLDLLHRKSLVAFLHTLDVDLAEDTRAQGCPTVRGRSTGASTSGSLGVAPRTCQPRMPSA